MDLQKFFESLYDARDIRRWRSLTQTAGAGYSEQEAADIGTKKEAFEIVMNNLPAGFL